MFPITPEEFKKGVSGHDLAADNAYMVGQGQVEDMRDAVTAALQHLDLSQLRAIGPIVKQMSDQQIVKAQHGE